MIAIAMKDRTVEITAFNTSYNDKTQKFQLWGAKKSDGKNFVFFEADEEYRVTTVKNAIDKAVELGEYLFDLKVGE